MKPKRAHSRKSAVITNSRWVAYATAGAASALTCVDSARATIHYSGPINHKFFGSSYEYFQLDQIQDQFYLGHDPHYYSTFTRDGGSAFFGIFGNAGASFAGYYVSCAYNSEIASVSNLSRAEAISTRPFVPGGRGLMATVEGFDCGGGWRGQFLQAGIGFIGFKFNNGSGDQYGWARIEMREFSSKHQFKLIDYAYGDVGDRIKAGQKSSHEQAPDRGSLGWLAAGAAGLLAWRKSRSLIAQ
jgi:hypothetical protein